VKILHKYIAAILTNSVNNYSKQIVKLSGSNSKVVF